jgi:1-deoxy-D-xylulose-5-phosphate synthase
MVLPGTMFEEMGFNYIGPIDGHDVDALVGALLNIKERKGPQLLHVTTKKGAGTRRRRTTRSSITRAESSIRGRIVARRRRTAYTRSSATGCATSEADPKLVGDHAGECAKLGPGRFRRSFPSAISTSGSAEQHAVTFSPPACSAKGCKPVVAIYRHSCSARTTS